VLWSALAVHRLLPKQQMLQALKNLRAPSGPFSAEFREAECDGGMACIKIPIKNNMICEFLNVSSAGLDNNPTSVLPS
jgi:hypothetical protein